MRPKVLLRLLGVDRDQAKALDQELLEALKRQMPADEAIQDRSDTDLLSAVITVGQAP